MKDDDLLIAARDRMAEAVDADRENRIEAMDDLEKLVGDQWPEEIRREREAENKPILTMNRMPQFVRQVTGDLRRMNPAISIAAADQESSKETAEILEGLVRQIEYSSDASSVYEQAAESAAACSIGWFRVLNDWVDDKSFEQELSIKRIRNSFSVYCDPAAEMPTREDAGYLFITENMRARDFKAAYPNANAESFEIDAETDGLEHWQVEDGLVIAEYYWKEPATKVIGLLEDGSVVEDPPAPLVVVRKRTVETHKVMWAKVSGHEVLEGPTEQPCSQIPVIAITGEEWHVGDRVHRSSVIRYAKDAQQMYNYWRSAETEFAALQPKSPYLVTAKQIAGLETFWNEANTKNRPYLPYNPDEKAAPPQRMPPPMTSQAMFQQVLSAAEDMKATTGIFDSGLGNQSNETSGVAIRQRQMESDVSTSIYADNMAKAIACCGRVLVDMIPKIYDTPRILRIIGKDGSEKMTPVNGLVIAQDGIQSVNDLTTGTYTVRVSVGPNYSTKRQETAEGMIEFIRAFPAAAQVTSDLVAKSMDWPDADQFADRLKKTLPPELRDPEDMDPEEQQQMQQAMLQQQQQMQMQAQMHDIEMQRSQAAAQEAQADARKAGVEVVDAELELAAKSGQLDEAIGRIVQEHVARALQGAMQLQ